MKAVFLEREGEPVMLLVKLDCSDAFFREVMGACEETGPAIEKLRLGSLSVADLTEMGLTLVAFRSRRKLFKFLEKSLDREEAEFLKSTVREAGDFGVLPVERFIFVNETNIGELGFTRAHVLECLAKLLLSAEEALESRAFELEKEVIALVDEAASRGVDRELAKLCSAAMGRAVTCAAAYTLVLRAAPELRGELFERVAERLGSLAKSIERGEGAAVAFFFSWLAVLYALDLAPEAYLKLDEEARRWPEKTAFLEGLANVLRCEDLTSSEGRKRALRELFEKALDFFPKVMTASPCGRRERRGGRPRRRPRR